MVKIIIWSGSKIKTVKRKRDISKDVRDLIEIEKEIIRRQKRGGK